LGRCMIIDSVEVESGHSAVGIADGAAAFAFLSVEAVEVLRSCSLHPSAVALLRVARGLLR
jgi:hypothetical protein